MNLKEKQIKRKPTELEEEIMYRVQRNIEKFNEDLLTKENLLVKNLITNKKFEVHYYKGTIIIIQNNHYKGIGNYEEFLTLLAKEMYRNIKENQHSGYNWK